MSELLEQLNAEERRSTSDLYGNHIQNKLFNLYDGLINFNHGSFGTVPKPVLDIHFRYMLEQESCPENWFRTTYYKYIDRSRSLLAKLIHAEEKDVVLVENASYAVNAILRSFDFKVFFLTSLGNILLIISSSLLYFSQKGDAIILFSSAYRMVVDTIKFLIETTGVEIIEVPILYPVQSEQDLIDGVAKAFDENVEKTIRMCIFSHISSMVSKILAEVMNAFTPSAFSLYSFFPSAP